MAEAHTRLRCGIGHCRFIIEPENEEAAIELAQKHMREGHGQDFTPEELQQECLQVMCLQNTQRQRDLSH